MFENTILVDRIKHRHKSVKRYDRFDFSSSAVSAPLGLSELDKASHHYPLVFSANGPFVPVALLGSGVGGNLQITDDGQWSKPYVPAHIRRYPFILGEQGDASSYSLMIEESAFAEDGDGEALFASEDSADENSLCDRALAFLAAYQRDLRAAEDFCTPLQEAGVMVAKEIRTTQDGELKGRITGVLVVDEDLLAQLDPELLSKWNGSGLLKLVYRHLTSLERLA